MGLCFSLLYVCTSKVWPGASGAGRSGHWSDCDCDCDCVCSAAGMDKAQRFGWVSGIQGDEDGGSSAAAASSSGAVPGNTGEGGGEDAAHVGPR